MKDETANATSSVNAARRYARDLTREAHNASSRERAVILAKRDKVLAQADVAHESTRRMQALKDKTHAHSERLAAQRDVARMSIEATQAQRARLKALSKGEEDNFDDGLSQLPKQHAGGSAKRKITLADGDAGEVGTGRARQFVSKRDVMAQMRVRAAKVRAEKEKAGTVGRARKFFSKR